MKFNKFLYWFSVVGPLYDIIYGAITGIVECVNKYSDNRRYISELNKFNSDNIVGSTIRLDVDQVVSLKDEVGE